MGILREHIAHMEKEELNAQQSELTAFFLTALDFRAEHCQVSLCRRHSGTMARHLWVVGVFFVKCLRLRAQGNLDETAAVEGGVIDCLLAMVMKLSEVTFRPLFFKVRTVDWRAGSAQRGRV